MNEHPGIQFEMQEGYFACSVSRSQMPAVMRYIADQKEHHYKMDSAAEFESLLKRHGFNCGINAGFVSSLKGLGDVSRPFPRTAVPGYRLSRPFGTLPTGLGTRQLLWFLRLLDAGKPLGELVNTL